MPAIADTVEDETDTPPAFLVASVKKRMVTEDGAVAVGVVTNCWKSDAF